jgi:protein-L-isoaspartate(D-aspartate) O-methyltransferase
VATWQPLPLDRAIGPRRLTRDSAQLRLGHLGYSNIGSRVGDVSRGRPEHTPYDEIMVAAAAEAVPSVLLEQLKPAGRLVMPIGPADAQNLTVVDKDVNDVNGRVSGRAVIPVRFTRRETGCHRPRRPHGIAAGRA